jgi:hypothetical protein
MGALGTECSWAIVKSRRNKLNFPRKKYPSRLWIRIINDWCFLV